MHNLTSNRRGRQGTSTVHLLVKHPIVQSRTLINSSRNISGLMNKNMGGQTNLEDVTRYCAWSALRFVAPSRFYLLSHASHTAVLYCTVPCHRMPSHCAKTRRTYHTLRLVPWYGAVINAMMPKIHMAEKHKRSFESAMCMCFFICLSDS